MPELPPTDDLHPTSTTKEQASGDKSAAATEAMPEHIGPYKIHGVLGRGGMGVVYLAEQERPRRRVALKVIRPDALSAERLRRFEFEVEVLGRLQHPGIAQIHQAGTTDAGQGLQPFFAMELIDGLPLTTYADQRGLSTRQRLELFVKVCAAIHHAHQKGVIHRDLKPGNILVDAAGQPKVLDFGVARVTDAGVDTSPGTDIGQLVGTIPYMSPEQVTGEPGEVDTRSDVYTLGVICYLLLAGRLPHDVRGKPVPQAVRIISDAEPTPLSSVSKAFRGDLDRILATALEKDKRRRYQSASELAADIERYLRDEPIAARPGGAVYRFGKFARRNKALVTAGSVLLVAVLVGGWLWAASLIQRERADRAEAEQQRLQAESDARAAQADLARERATRAEEEQRRLRADNHVQEARAAAQRGKWLDALAGYDRALKEGHRDPIGLRLERARALFALNDHAGYAKEIANLGAEPNLGPHKGAVLLLQGEAALAVDNDKALSLLQQARKEKLSASEDAYARALLAETAPRAVELFQQVLLLDPHHQQARNMLALSLALRGDLQEARLQARTAELLFPDDPNVPLLQALFLACAGEMKAANETLDRSEESATSSSARQLIGTLRVAMQLLGELRDWEKLSNEEALSRMAKTFIKLGPAAERVFQVPKAAKDDEALLAAARLMPLPPVLHNGFGRMFRAANLLSQGKDAEALKELASLAEINPEGFVFMMQGTVLFGNGQFKEAEAALLRAADMPSLISVRRPSLFLAVMAAWNRVAAARPKPEPEPGVRARAIANIRKIMALGEVPPSQAYWLWNIAGQDRQLDLARSIIADWERQAPNDIEAKVARATIERVGGAYQKALDILEDVVKKNPKHEEALRNQRLARQKLEELRKRPEK
jgi:tetratricopeptide (TPR) repeat protein/predicted Ser/Thr protein kinase